MSRAWLRLLCLILLISFALGAVSCNRSYDEEEVLSEAKTLMKRAEKLNFIYFGSGIRYYEDEDAKGYYRKASESHLSELGFSTVDELKQMTEQTFTDAYSEVIYTTMLSALKDDTSVVTPARYYQARDEKTGEPTHIMVYSAFTPLLRDSIEYDYSSMWVSGVKKERVYVTVTATVTNKDGQSQSTDIVITLVEEEDGWRIDNPTYANYNSRA